MRRNRKVKQVNYVDAHNKAVRSYKKTSMFLMWAGLISVFASIIGVIQIAANSTLEGNAYLWPTSGFALNFSIEIYLSSLFIQNLDIGLAYFLIILTSIIFAGIFVTLSIFSSKGYKVLLILGSALYALDFIFMFFIYVFLGVPKVWTNYAFTLVTHIVVCLGLIYAIIQYYNVLHIEKVFNKSPEMNLNEEVESEVIASGK